MNKNDLKTTIDKFFEDWECPSNQCYSEELAKYIDEQYRKDKFDGLKDLIINDVVGKSALKNWGVDNFDQQPFSCGDIAYNRFYRLTEKILNYLKGE